MRALRSMASWRAGRIIFLLGCLIAGPALVMAALAPPLHAQEGDAASPRVLLILDASRSMWGQIDGINKIVSARSVIGQTAKQLESKSQFGLMAYGHRQSAGCRDIETVLQMGAHKADDIAKAVNGVRPKGSTPIAAALSEGAKAVGSEQHKASIILVADGLDNCKGDPCAVSSELKDKGKDLTIHTIAFDRKEKEALKTLSCVAENTGGTFASATSEAELQAALSAAVGLVLNPPAPPPPVAVQPATAPKAAGQSATAGDQTENELAALNDADAVTQGEPPGKAESIAPSQPPAAETAPEKKQAAAAPTGPVAVSFDALLTETGPVIKHGLVWRIFDSKPGADGRYKLINTYREASPTAELTPGQYLVNAAYGLSHLTKMVSVQGSDAIKETLVLNAGGLRLGATMANGQKLAPNSVSYDIFADEADQFGKREKVIGNAKPGLIIRLNAGAYHIVSVYGDANAIVRADVTVEPGKLTEATINHAAARVTFKLVTKPGGEALADARWSILTPSGDVVKESAGALPTHILAAGRYTVLARFQGKDYSRDFTIDTGEVKQIEVVIR